MILLEIRNTKARKIQGNNDGWQMNEFLLFYWEDDNCVIIVGLLNNMNTNEWIHNMNGQKQIVLRALWENK